MSEQALQAGEILMTPMVGHRTEVSSGINVPACEVHVEVGVILEHESADENVSPEGTFLWNHHRDKATMQSLQWWSCSCTLQKAAYDLASSWTGPKSGETLHTLCHIFTRNNPKATAPVQVCHFKLPYFFMDPV